VCAIRDGGVKTAARACASRIIAPGAASAPRGRCVSAQLNGVAPLVSRGYAHPWEIAAVMVPASTANAIALAGGKAAHAS